MLSMSVAELGSTGSLEMSLFHALSAGEMRRPPRLAPAPSPGEVVHLARGDVVEVKVPILLGELFQGLMEPDHRFAEQRFLVWLRCPVRVEFDKEPVGARAHLHSGP